MEDFTWIKELIREFEEDIALKRKSLKKYQYDMETTDELNSSIFVQTNLIASLKRQLPVAKLQDNEDTFKCPNCKCVVNRYAMWCHYCGQRMSNDSV